VFERNLPPLLKAELPPEAEAFMAGLEVAGYDRLWEVGEHVPHARVRAYAAGKLALFDGSRPTGVSIPIVAYVLQVGDLTLAIDSGLAERWRSTATEAAPDDAPGPGQSYRPVLDGPGFAEQLASEGIRVDRSVCTHLHVDHAGGAGELGVPVEASAEELAEALAGDAPGYPAEDFAGVEFSPIRLDGGPVGPFPRHAELAPGVLALSTAGHTGGSISVFACLGRTWALVCGDAAYPVADQPASDAYRGMLRIRRALAEIGGTLVLAGHDTTVLRACSDGAWLGGEAPDQDPGRG
jgi:glyoxylase-like metal-dependent hydrolase (beta-lactamase superfamily II)